MLELEHISVRFAAGHGVQAVEDVSFTLEDGGRLAIVGETGSGKSVLLLSVLRLLPKSALVSGSARLDGEDLFAAGQKRLREIRGGVISYVPQGGGASLNPLYSVGFQVGEPLMEHRGYSKKEAFLASIPLLKRFQLGREEQLARGYPHTFSGGMRRLETEALLCVTHDLQFAASVCRKVCVMYAAQQVEYGSADQVLGQPLHPYTQAMVQAMPENGMHVREGFAPETASGSGCRFRARCPYARAQCEAMPPLVTVNDRKVRCWRYAAGNETADQTLSEPR